MKARAVDLSTSDLTPDPENRRKHSKRNVAMIAASLKLVGPARSIVIDEDHVVLAGNGVMAAAAETGFTKVQVVDAAGDELIAVRRTGLTAAQKRDLAIYDNRTAELAKWDPEQLQKDLAGGVDLTPFFFKDELLELLKPKTPADSSVGSEAITCPKCGAVQAK